jgi:hypothetical protein
MNAPHRPHKTRKSSQPPPPRREKSNMDEPQEEFIEPVATPSQTMKSHSAARQSDTRKQAS